ncbi:hypothetical protein HUT19_22295 [Streptomyces sp. NA02950]|uniref:hypothetical protein n=1 Tax=Streptomyces sp. NA02950 TaxID=2742137 RepID=UPI0015900FA3|nr:hypothetical protein [Streptomyces sp. NA02950]QKV94154.1 hypothetical protein HUT19_22295 [Streptomyces sp. NA02950]
MPRGRHRQSPPLHRLLTPLSVAGASITCAGGAWLVGDTVVIRGLVATAAAAAVVGAVLMRRWDRAAGRRVAEAASETARQELKYEERIADLEADAEKSAELRTALNTKLRAKRAELARLRNEHAELLRRYATAETERASALEGRRRLALEAATPAPELAAGPSSEPVDSGESGESAESGGAETAAAAESSDAAASPATAAPTAEAYAKADEALGRLVPNARRQQEERERQRSSADQDTAERDGAGDGPGDRGENRDKDGAAAPGKSPAADERDGPPEPRSHARTVASAVVPYAAARRAAARTESGFDYFGTQKKHPKKQRSQKSGPEAAASASAASAAGAADEEDLADVIGAETMAETEKDAEGEVIDLTAHDETEQIEIAELRSAIS